MVISAVDNYFSNGDDNQQLIATSSVMISAVESYFINGDISSIDSHYTAKTSVNILTLYDVYLEQQIININRCSI